MKIGIIVSAALLQLTQSAPLQIQPGEEFVCANRLMQADLFPSEGGSGASSPSPALASAQRSVLGPQHTIFMMVNFADKPDDKPWSLETINAVFAQTAAYVYETSYHQVRLTGKAEGWHTLPINSTVDCDTAVNTMEAYSSRILNFPGVDLTPYQRIMYFFPKRSDCLRDGKLWNGLGQVGGSRTTAWINGDIRPVVVFHELFHGFGSGHGRFAKCGNADTVSKECREEYGDPTTTMGNIYAGQLNAFQKEQLGWLGTPGIEVVTADGHFLLEPLEIQSQNRKVLKIRKSNLNDGSTDDYYVEFRQGLGFDQGLERLSDGSATNNLVQGVLIHQGNSLVMDSSLLLDMNPTTPSALDAALTVGKTFSDANVPQGGVSIRVNSISAAGVDVSVTFGKVDTGAGQALSPKMMTTLGLWIAAMALQM